MVTIKKIFLLVCFTIGMSNFSNAQVCPKRGCDPHGWNAIKDGTEGTIIDSEINSSSGQMFMYNARDFVGNSAQVGYMASEIYDYWDEVSLELPMLYNYKTLYSEGLESKMTELMYPSGQMENIPFMSSAMYSTLKNIISHHKQATSNQGFINLLNHADSVIDDMQGKTISQVRSIYFPCGQSEWC